MLPPLHELLICDILSFESDLHAVGFLSLDVAGLYFLYSMIVQSAFQRCVTLRIRQCPICSSRLGGERSDHAEP